MNNQVQTFSFNPPINLDEERKLLLAVTSFKAFNFVFKKTNGTYSFSITTPGHWDSKSAEKTINELK